MIIKSIYRSGSVRCALAALALSLMAASCGGRESADGAFGEGFDKLSDARKVAYVMQNAAPDSVARFICNAALGKVPGASIDTLATATLYAYEHYTDEADLQTFSAAYDEYAASLPLDDKMRIMKMAGEVDPQGIGYELGLEYVDRIRRSHRSSEEVVREIEAFRKACSSDTMMFRRFLTGFKVALEVDRGKDLPDDIYTKFKNYK